MNASKKINFIKEWIINYCKSINKKPESLIVGVSGGVDSAVTSTICAMTNIVTYVVSMPIKQNSSQHDLSLRHLEFLEQNYPNVETKIIELDNVFKKPSSSSLIFPSDSAI